jgi:hypothetical protein
MPGHRKQAEQYCLAYIEKMLPGGTNANIYKNKFASMSDEEFERFIEDLESGKTRLSVVVPNFSHVRIDLERNFAVAKELGHEFFHHILMPAKGGVPAYLTPIKYLVVDLPMRRQAQTLEKKISIPEDNLCVDDMTGQPTGRSKGSKISYPEVQIMAAKGLDLCIEELMKYRGGDEKGFAAMNAMILRTGAVSLKAIAPFASGVKSVQALKAFLAAMQLKSTL